MSQLQEHSINGLTQAFIDDGEGQALVLIHGSLCDHRYWRFQAPNLAAKCRVVIPSLRHYWPLNDPEAIGFSAEQHATDLINLLQHLGIDKAHLLGHSRGAAVAVRMAQQAPERVASLILADPGLRNPQELQEGISWKASALQLIQSGALDEGLEIFIDAVSGEGTWVKMVPWFKRMVRDNANTLDLQQHERPVLFDRDELAPLAQFKISLIGGAQSPDPFPHIIRELSALWPEATVYILENATHGMNLAMPQAFNQAVLAHIRV
ncbi:Putative aminoacrylate hydrolase RutD [Oligella sp. MSHR50489EDL]|uniref:alpha/beta fold hydrolase n=1 Tax=Oligella sp. MSHR50489EDL TaxID=3139409 RepID=UPI003D817CB6